MVTKTAAIVLHSFKLTDNKLVVDMLIADGTRVACVAAVSHSPRARIRRQLFQPMTLLSVEYDSRPSARLKRLHEAQIVSPYTTLYGDPVKLSLSLFVAEFLYNATKGEQQNPELFAYIVNSMRWLDTARTTACANFHVVFTMRLSRFLGFLPNTDNYQRGAVFDLRGACFSTALPAHGDYLSPVDSERLLTLIRMDYDTMYLFRMTRADRNYITDVIMRFYRLQLPAFPEPRSLQVLRELWA